MSLGFFDWFSSSPKSVGEDLLKSYYNEASKFSDFSVQYPSYESFTAFVLSKVPDYIELLGELVISNEASTSVEQAIERVAYLANESAGKATLPQIVQSAGGSGDTINWSAAIPQIASETASDIVETTTEIASSVGEGVISTLKVTKYLPWILGGAAVVYLVMLSGGQKAILNRFMK